MAYIGQNAEAITVMKDQQSALRAQKVSVMPEWKRQHPCFVLGKEHPMVTKDRAECDQTEEMAWKRSRK